jgi:hypothetical protein
MAGKFRFVELVQRWINELYGSNRLMIVTFSALNHGVFGVLNFVLS